MPLNEHSGYKNNTQFYFKEEKGMKRKKLLSTILTGALMASQMVMPVMAADGQVDVDLTTKTGVVRVEVPTTMAIAVDQFEIGQAGAQLASSEFDMVNKSEMAVKVEVTSTVTLGEGISLVPSVDAVKKSTGNDAWLAVAAKTASGSYDDPKTTGEDATEDSWDLTEASSNVTTFATSEGASTAEQTFYLAKALGTEEYKLAVADDSGKIGVSYAKFYALTEDNTITDDASLAAAVAAHDVYVMAKDAADGATVTKIAEGGTGTYDGDANAYYTAAADAATTITADTKYVYAAMGTAGGAAGFTYVAKLSDSKAIWTKDDIKKISIAYTITGVTASNYDEVKDDCTYGLYTPVADAAPSIATKEYKMVADTDVAVNIDLGAGDLAAEGIESITYDKSGTATALADANYTYEDGVLTFKGAYITKVLAATDSRDYVIEFNDTAKTKVTIKLSK